MNSLLVDDNFISRKLLASILKDYGHCDQASGGQEAVDMVIHGYEENEPYELICLDVLMPGMDGLEVLQKIRAYEKERGLAQNEECKIMMVTSLDDKKSIFKAFKSGCEFYVTKPLEKQKVLDTLRAQQLIK